MREFQTIDVSADAPKEIICSECTPTGIDHNFMGIVSVYCSHRQAGGWRARGDEMWTIYAPITAEAFATRMRCMFSLATLEVTHQRSTNRTH